MKKSRWSFISKVDVYTFLKFNFLIHFTKLVKIKIFICYKQFRWNNIESEELKIFVCKSIGKLWKAFLHFN